MNKDKRINKKKHEKVRASFHYEVQTTIDDAGIIKPETGKYEVITFEEFYKAIFKSRKGK